MLPSLISKTKILQNKRERSREKKEFATKGNLKLVKRRGSKIRSKKKFPANRLAACQCNSTHLSSIVIGYRSKKRCDYHVDIKHVSWNTLDTDKEVRLPSVQIKKKEKYIIAVNDEEFFRNLECQLNALNLGKTIKNKNKGETPASQRSKGDAESNDTNEAENKNKEEIGAGEIRRRGKRRRKVRGGGSDRLTSAGLAAQSQQDPETQIAGIGTDSHNASSRGSVVIEEDIQPPQLVVKQVAASSTDSFLDGDILKHLHREVDEEAFEMEFDPKRRYVLQEALRTRGTRPVGPEMQNILRSLQVSPVCLADLLHLPRAFSRQNATFSLPIDCTSLETLSPMSYAARFVTIKKSKQLLYLTVLRKFRPEGYVMPIKDIAEGLVLMMGGILNMEQAIQYKSIMEWDSYVEAENFPDEIKLTILDEGYKARNPSKNGDTDSILNTTKYRTWCGLCAICERMYGRFRPREEDPPDGMELSDFTMIETKLAVLKVHSGLVEILNVIRIR